MLSSIGGQNEGWARSSALQPSPGSLPGGDGGAVFGNTGTATTDLPPISPIAGSTVSPLSSDTNFLLTVFGGAARSGGGTGPLAATGKAIQDQTIGQSQQHTSARSGPSAPSVNAASDASTGTSLVQELQTLVSPGATVQFASGAPPSATRSALANGGDAIGNSDTVVPSWHNGWDNTNGPSDAGRQQAGLSAYASRDLAGQASATTPVLQGITV